MDNSKLEKLLIKAKELQKNAYVPYSQFRVAVIVGLKNNQEVLGVNVENASFPASICAERIALAQAVALGYKKEDIDFLFLITDSISFIGKPNVGKSTLLNTILKEKVAIVSHKPQTTREQLQGIYTDDKMQIIFLDTPGIHKHHNQLAVKEVNLNVLLKKIYDYLPLGSKFFEVEQKNPSTTQQIAREVIREKIIFLTRQEIPYSVAVVIESMETESEGVVFIDALVEEDEVLDEDALILDSITDELNLKNTMTISNDTRRKDGIKSYFNILGTSQILTQGQEINYAKMLESKDPEERDFAFKQLFNSNLKLVVSVARRHLNRGLAFEDLIQEELGREPTPEEIADVMGQNMNANRILEIKKLASEPVPLEKPIGEEDDTHFEVLTRREEKVIRMRFGILPTKLRRLLELCEDDQELKELKEAMNEIHLHYDTSLDKPEIIRNKIIYKHISKCDTPKTLEEVGREFSVTRERIRQIEAKAIRKLKHPSKSKLIKEFYKGEMKWHQELEARDKDINVLILGHNMEEKFVNFINEKKPREKAIKYGIDSLNDEELLAILLRTGTKEKDVLHLAKDIISTFKGIENFNKVNFSNLIKIKGIGASNGVAVSKVLILKEKLTKISDSKISEKDLNSEINKIDVAIKNVKNELKELIIKTRKNLGEQHAAIFEAHLSILEDPELYQQIKILITNEKWNVSKAVTLACDNYYQIFSTLEDEYMRERAADILDIKTKLLNQILGIKDTFLSDIKDEVIIVANDLTPSQTSQLNPNFVKGFLCNIGGRTSHSAIMARSLGIPAVVGLKNITSKVQDDEYVALNGYRAIRLSLDQKDIFKTQIRALLRASVYGQLAIMFPMIATVEEFKAAKEFVLNCKKELIKEGQKPYHPAILRLIKMTIDGAKTNEKEIPVGMCGEMAGDKIAVPLLVGMGLDEFSMSASDILATRKLINSLNKKDMEALVKQALACETNDQVEKKKRIEVYAPVSGEVIRIEDVKDPVFANKMLGDGLAIIPKGMKQTSFVAPISGILTTTLDAGHAYGITEKSTKIECLVHIGMDTVELNGRGFDVKVKKLDKITAKDLMVIVDLEAIKKSGKDITTPIVFTKETIGEYGYKINILKHGKVKQGDVIAELVKE
ncbi:phosphoenolpyruvate-protein phosphotransferase [Lasius niger]|uniref:Phosphoenolpyruvate-protein phosphotransferase n=1 Tax=Lasius niger TaxID=67767 RepID=A0A0J7P126_LASNI|nr:phosphoenolpyruvate-protein phosphotransferase [Lasius niger]